MLGIFTQYIKIFTQKYILPPLFMAGVSMVVKLFMARVSMVVKIPNQWGV